MGQNALFTGDNEMGCDVNLSFFAERLRGDGTYVTEFEVEKADTGYVPWFVAVDKESSQLRSGCVSEAPEPIIQPEILTWEIEHVEDNLYEMSATFANLEPDTTAYLRRVNGDGVCELPNPIAENSNPAFASMAQSILGNGSYTTSFGVRDFVSVMLIIADSEGNVLDYKNVCRDYE